MWGDRGPQANKADVEAKDNIAEYGYTPLHWASQKGHEKVAQLLVVRDEGQGRGKMSVYAGPGEGVEGEGCWSSICIYIDICTGTWVYFFLCIGCTYILTCSHGHILYSV